MRLTTCGLLIVVSVGVVSCNTDDGATAPTHRVVSIEALRASARATVSTVTACGASVVTDLRLEEDLTCSGDGLIVDSDGIRIDLNGHTITGAGVGNGITVRSHHDVSISGGTIRSFVTGVFVATSTDVVIKDNGFTRNREGVFLNGSSGNTVKNNAAWDNSSRGIMLRPTMSGTISTNNVVMDNVLTSNSAGIKFGAGWTGNTFLENTIQANACGIQGPSIGNIFKENLFSANAADLCP